MTAKGFAAPFSSKAVRYGASGAPILNRGKAVPKCCISVKNVQAVGGASRFAKLAPLNRVKKIAVNLNAENAPPVFNAARFARLAPESESARM